MKKFIIKVMSAFKNTITNVGVFFNLIKPVNTLIFESDKKCKYTVNGCIKSTPSVKDHMYANVRAMKTDLPAKFELKMNIIKDQGKAGSCVGQAISAIQEWDAEVRYNAEAKILSPLYIYSETKAVDGIASEGTSIKTALDVLTKKGICEESLYPYSDSQDIINLKFPMKNTTMYNNAKKYTTKGYAKLNNVQEVKNAVYNENGAILGLLVTDSFQDAPNGVIDQPLGSIYGMHAVAVKGWDDTMIKTVNGKTYKGFLIIQNSWGTQWGDNGIGYIPYDQYDWTLLDFPMRFIDEAWTTYDFLDADSNLNYHKPELDKPVDPELEPIPPTEENIEIQLTIGSKDAYVNGVKHTLPVAPISHENTSMVPVRFVSEILGYKVDWNQTLKRITITK